MRKISFLLLAFIAFLPASHSQIRMALLGGGHQSTVAEENNLPDWPETRGFYSGRTGVRFGFLADIPVNTTSKLSFQPSVQYQAKGRKYAQQFDPSASIIISEKSTQHVNYIDVPLNIVYKTGKKAKFIVGAGPYAGFFFNGKETAESYTQSGILDTYENDDLPVGKKPGQYRVVHFGVNALAGVEFGRVFITANYSRGLNDFYTATDYDGSFRHQVIGGTLGIFIGKPVSVEKKVKDKDKDGIPDDQDYCPDEPGTALTNGCPDKDGDGIADKDDKCPDVTGLKKYDGCPIPDTDKDGINDEEDKCPETAGLKKYKGCPAPDTDKDGINDEEDRCPDVAGVKENNGCPADRDGDGVYDADDKCPDEAGTKENNGCPEIQKELVEKVNYAAKNIQFQANKAELTSSSYTVLDEVVAILNENPGLTLSIEGHTSSDGTLAANMKLSEARAASVEAYLLSKGINKNRLTAKGYGPTQPLNEGKTSAERAANRRVELKLSN